MSSLPQPIYLFADSQLLYWKNNGELFLRSIKEGLETESPKAAYIGASNGDEPAYYGIFESAMANIDIHNCRMIVSSFSSRDRAFVEDADIILLAGGDVENGWKVIQANGLDSILIKKYYSGAILIGISAGAIQLGCRGYRTNLFTQEGGFDTLRLVPFIVGVHEEKTGWEMLMKTVSWEGEYKGIGIPSGGGMIYHADHAIEPIRRPLHEFAKIEGQLTQNLLFGDLEEGQK